MAGALLLPGDEFCQLKGGELNDGLPRLGVVAGGSLAGGKGSFIGSPCNYCGEVAGHTAQRPVVS